MKITNGNFTVYFDNSSRSNRSGFVHETTLFDFNHNPVHAKIQYYNRTWEYFRYHTVMCKAFRELQETVLSSLKTAFLDRNGYAKMTAKRKAEFEAEIADNKEMKFYRSAYEALKNARNDCDITL